MVCCQGCPTKSRLWGYCQALWGILHVQYVLLVYMTKRSFVLSFNNVFLILRNKTGWLFYWKRFIIKNNGTLFISNPIKTIKFYITKGPCLVVLKTGVNHSSSVPEMPQHISWAFQSTQQIFHYQGLHKTD